MNTLWKCTGDTLLDVKEYIETQLKWKYVWVLWIIEQGFDNSYLCKMDAHDLVGKPYLGEGGISDVIHF